MRHLRKFCATITLICAFAFSAYAGNIECPGVTSQPPLATRVTPGSDITETAILVLLALVK